VLASTARQRMKYTELLSSCCSSQLATVGLLNVISHWQHNVVLPSVRYQASQRLRCIETLFATGIIVNTE